MDIKAFAPQFEQALNLYNDSKDRQKKQSNVASEAAKQARLYLSHFIQVFNMCIARGEIKPEMRNLLKLDASGSNVPDIQTDRQLFELGPKVVEGENLRMRQGNGGSRIYNPSMAVVAVKIDTFIDNYTKQQDMLKTVSMLHEKLSALRDRADELILALWNEVEASYAPVDSDEKRDLCSAYGVVYFYRPQERQKDFMMGRYE